MTGTITTQIVGAAKAAREHPPQRRVGVWKQLSRSFVVLSILMLVACDLAARAFFHPDRYSSINRSWTWWTVKGFRQNQAPVDVAVFGSSLMLAALNGSDALFTNTTFDAIDHHQAEYFNHLLRAKLGRPIRSFSFAIGGQMASDVFAMATTLFQSHNQPSVILWGIAPRDFLDATFKHPNYTETVRYINKIANVNVLGERKSFWETVEDFLGQVIYLYGKRHDVVIVQQQLCQAFLKRLALLPKSDRIQAPFELIKIAMVTLPEDVVPGEFVVKPHEPNREIYTDNSKEYIQRYNPFAPKTLKQQLAYLEKFLNFARSRGIKVCLVNMPLTEDNMNLLPKGAYSAYLCGVERTAAKYGATVLDVNKKGVFNKSEFFDPVHVTALGGMKLFRLIANQDWQNLAHKRCEPR
jgi:hypothetical protein